MPDSKISALPQAATLTGIEVAPVVQSGATVKASVQQLATAITGATGTNGETTTTNKPRLDLAQTWNAAGTTFTGVKLNVTDTASAAGSLLADFQAGGVSRLSVGKNTTVVTSSSASAQVLQLKSAAGVVSNHLELLRSNNSVAAFWGTTNNSEYYLNAGYQVIANTAFFNSNFLFNGTNLIVASASVLSWTASGNAQQAVELSLLRDAANTLAQRNGVNAQTHRIYGTFTDASNYRRLTKTMSAGGVAEIKPEGAGTGASGNVLHISGLPTANPGPGILWNDAGTVKVGT